MREILPQKLIALAEKCPEPLYVVGGFVRDYLAGLAAKAPDIDLSSPMDADTFLDAAKSCGFIAAAVYRNTGTVKLKDAEGTDYEYTCFRSDRYVRGTHVPIETFFTKDMLLDAKRRDFTVNAVYYDVARGEWRDPLHGMEDIRAKRLSTVDRAEKVFGEDGLRLMRLARQAGQLGFSPSPECLAGAKANASLIKDISPERIWTELTAILRADEKYGNPRGHYEGLKVLEETGVLDYILPELALGKNMAQREDFHKYDVLEHTLRAVLYADGRVRLAALLHDVGKPFCLLRDGNEVGNDSLLVLLLLFHDEHVRKARQRRRSDVVAHLVVPCDGTHRFKIALKHRPVEGNADILICGDVDRHEQIDLAAADVLLNALLQRVLCIGKSAGQTHAAIEKAVVDGAKLHGDFAAVQSLHRAAVAGHALNQNDPLLFLTGTHCTGSSGTAASCSNRTGRRSHRNTASAGRYMRRCQRC